MNGLTYSEAALALIQGGVAFGLALALGVVVVVNLGFFLKDYPANRRRKKYQREMETQAQRDVRMFDAITEAGIVSYHKPIRIYPQQGAMGRKWVASLDGGVFSDEMPDEQELLARVIEVAFQRAERAKAEQASEVAK